jgi:hypothetical protein
LVQVGLYADVFKQKTAGGSAADDCDQRAEFGKFDDFGNDIS